MAGATQATAILDLSDIWAQVQEMTQIKTQWVPIFFLLVAGLFSAAQFGKFTLTLDVLSARYGAVAPFLVSIVGIVGIVFGAVAGAHVARAGLRRALLWALWLGAVVSLIEAVLPVTPLMLALRILEGVSHLTIVVAAPTLMAGFASDRDRPVVMGIWASFFGISIAITALLLPGLLLLGGLSAVLVAHGAGIAVVALVLSRLLPPSPPSDLQKRSYVAEHIEIYSRPRAAIAGLGFVFYTLLYIALIAVLPGAIGLGIAMISILPLVSLVGTFAAGFLARRFAPPLLTMVGFGLTGLGFLGVAAVPGPTSAILLFLVIGVIPGGSFATIPYFNTTLEARARATGAIAQMGNVGTTAGTPVFVGALMLGGLPLVILVALAFCGLGMAVLAVMWRAVVAGDK